MPTKNTARYSSRWLAGLRQGDPKLTVATCNITAGKSGPYEKSVTCVAGLNDLYDVLSTHSYAMADAWPTWRRSYPEDPKIEFLKSIDWRHRLAQRQLAQDKPIWLTEFGWDASDQAGTQVRRLRQVGGPVNRRDSPGAVSGGARCSCLTAIDVERAYLYFFNDSDEPAFHGSSGITRNFEPKPSFHALVHLYQLLGEYRFGQRLLQKTGEVYAYEFVHASELNKTIIAVWSPTGSGRIVEVDVPLRLA